VETSSISANKIEKLVLKNNLPHMTDIETSHDLYEYSNNSVLSKHGTEMRTVFWGAVMPLCSGEKMEAAHTSKILVNT
jgi:hypothetical protein